MANKEIYAEASSFYMEENTFLDLTSDASFVALWRLKDRIHSTARIRKLHLMVDTNVFVPDNLADTIFIAEGKRRWLNKHSGEAWRPLATHTVESDSTHEIREIKTRYVVFQIQYQGRGIEIRAPCGLKAEHATKLEAYVKELTQLSTGRLDGHDLIRLAAQF